MSTFTLAISCLTTSNLPWFTNLTFSGSYAILLFTALDLASITSHTHNWWCFCFGSTPSFFLELFLHWSPVVYGYLPIWGVHLSVSYIFAFLYCSWGSQSKNTEVVCHSLLQWTTFCQTSPPWPVCLGWPHAAWLSFTELDKAVVCDCGLSLSALWFPLSVPTVLPGFLPALASYPFNGALAPLLSKLIVQRCLGLFLDSQLYSSGLYVYLYTSTTQLIK